MLAHLPFDRDSSVFTILSSEGADYHESEPDRDSSVFTILSSESRLFLYWGNDRDSSVFTILSSLEVVSMLQIGIEIVLFLQYSQATKAEDPPVD